MAYGFNNDKSKADLIDLVYPVGSIYMSVNSTSPATLFGGTWARWGNGRVPVGVDTGQTEFNTVEKTGGAKTHTLTVNQIPSHTHAQTLITSRTTNVNASGTSSANTGMVTETASTGATGGGTAHNNLQPYITCYMWKRTA